MDRFSRRTRGTDQQPGSIETCHTPTRPVVAVLLNFAQTEHSVIVQLGPEPRSARLPGLVFASACRSGSGRACEKVGASGAVGRGAAMYDSSTPTHGQANGADRPDPSSDLFSSPSGCLGLATR
jgi:hypothetical protein